MEALTKTENIIKVDPRYYSLCSFYKGFYSLETRGKRQGRHKPVCILG